MNEQETFINNQEDLNYSDYGSYNECEELLDCYQLVDSLVQDILTLEKEMVRWRQALLKYLSPIDAQNLLSDIFDNQVRRNYDNKSYQKYLKVFGYKEDPMESDEHVQMMLRLHDGSDETSVDL